VLPFQEGVENPIDPKDTASEDGREIIMVKSKERNNGSKAVTFIKNESLEITTFFPPKLPDPGSFSIPCMGKVEVARALYNLGASVSLVPYSLFHRLYLGLLQPTPFSLQLADGFKMQPFR